MKRMLLTISYDGTAYHGWQVQPNKRTVEGELEKVLEKYELTKDNLNKEMQIEKQRIKLQQLNMKARNM